MCLVENRQAGNAGCPCCFHPLKPSLAPTPTTGDRRAAAAAAEPEMLEEAGVAARQMAKDVLAVIRGSCHTHSAARAVAEAAGLVRAVWVAVAAAVWSRRW